MNAYLKFFNKLKSSCTLLFVGLVLWVPLVLADITFNAQFHCSSIVPGQKNIPVSIEIANDDPDTPLTDVQFSLDFGPIFRIVPGSLQQSPYDSGFKIRFVDGVLSGQRGVLLEKGDPNSRVRIEAELDVIDAVKDSYTISGEISASMYKSEERVRTKLSPITIPVRYLDLALGLITLTPPLSSVAGLSNSTGSMTIAFTGGKRDFEVTVTSASHKRILRASSSPLTIKGLIPGQAYTVSLTDARGETVTAVKPVIMPYATSDIKLGEITSEVQFKNEYSLNVKFQGSATTQYTVSAQAIAAAGVSRSVPIKTNSTGVAQAVLSGLPSGLYVVSVKDAAGNAVASGTPIAVRADVMREFVDTELVTWLVINRPETYPGFNDGSLTIVPDGGTPPYEFSILGGSFTSFVGEDTFTQLVPGVYSIVVKDSDEYRTKPLLQTVQAALPISIQAISQAPTVPGGNDGQITIQASGCGPLEYGLVSEPPMKLTPDNVIKGLTSGNYQVVVQDAFKRQSFSDIISVLPAISFAIKSVEIVPISSVGAKDARITVIAAGGVEPYTYSIDNGRPTRNNVLTGVGPGVHTIKVADAQTGVISYTTQDIADPKPLTMSISTVPVQGFDHPTGKIFAFVSGGTPPYRYSIDGGATFLAGNEFSGLGAGDYEILVQDAQGFFITQTVTLAQPTQVTIDKIAKTHVTYFGGSDGALTILAAGGTGNLLYSIDGGKTFTSSNVFKGLTAKSYAVVVKDEHNSIAQTSVKLLQPETLAIKGVAIHKTDTKTSASKVSISATGGATPLYYSINGGKTFSLSNVFKHVKPATLSIIVKDAQGAIATANAVVRS